MESGIHTVESRIQDCPGQMGSSSCLPLARPFFLAPSTSARPLRWVHGGGGGGGGGGERLVQFIFKAILAIWVFFH